MLSILQLKVLDPYRDRRQHILAIIIKDRASLHFVKHCDYLFETHAFFFQFVIFIIAPVIIGNLFDLITGLEIPVQSRFIGTKKSVAWAEKSSKKFLKTLNKEVNKYVKLKTVNEKKIDK